MILLAAIVVGTSAEQTKYLVWIAAGSLFVTASIFVLMVYKITQDHEQSRQKLSLEKLRLHSAIANMPHGVCMFGPDKRLVVANDMYSTMYRLSPEQAKPGTTLDAILRARVAIGSSPKDAEEYIANRLEEAFLPNPGTSSTSFVMGVSLLSVVDRYPMEVRLLFTKTLRRKSVQRKRFCTWHTMTCSLISRIEFCF